MDERNVVGGFLSRYSVVCIIYFTYTEYAEAGMLQEAVQFYYIR